jgi:ribonucleotide monophosphatase NagD (HAD superfamily)
MLRIGQTNLAVRLAQRIVQGSGATKGIPVDPSRILMVGDSLEYDIAGAHNAGIASLLVLSGNHKKTPRKDFPALFRKYSCPSYVLNRFSFKSREC